MSSEGNNLNITGKIIFSNDFWLFWPSGSAVEIGNIVTSCEELVEKFSQPIFYADGFYSMFIHIPNFGVVLINGEFHLDEYVALKAEDLSDVEFHKKVFFSILVDKGKFESREIPYRQLNALFEQNLVDWFYT